MGEKYETMEVELGTMERPWPRKPMTLSIGDKVFIRNNWGSGYSTAKVDRFTRTQIVVGNRRFRANGNEIGRPRGHLVSYDADSAAKMEAERKEKEKEAERAKQEALKTFPGLLRATFEKRWSGDDSPFERSLAADELARRHIEWEAEDTQVTMLCKMHDDMLYLAQRLTEGTERLWRTLSEEEGGYEIVTAGGRVDTFGPVQTLGTDIDKLASKISEVGSLVRTIRNAHRKMLSEEEQ